MIDEGVGYWVDSVAESIHELDPTALITVGVFAPNAPNAWRPEGDRLVLRASAFTDTAVDFIDLHAYPGYLPLDALMENFGVDEAPTLPRIMGEFGGFTFVVDSPNEAAAASEEWQVESCRLGVIGWFFWHWAGSDDHEVWTGSEGSGAVRRALAPSNRPDPCRWTAFSFFPTNLAHHAPVTASQASPEGPAGAAVDGWRSTSWRSGGGPEQWIELDLGQEFTIHEIVLIVDQYPPGETRHRILMAATNHRFATLGELTGSTAAGDDLHYRLLNRSPASATSASSPWTARLGSHGARSCRGRDHSTR